jgi:hypothetical protein
MELFYSKELAVPLFQVMLLLVAITGAILFGKTRLALIITYLFTLYWGYFFNGDLFNVVRSSTVFTAIYFGFGATIVMCALFAFLTRDD